MVNLWSSLLSYGYCFFLFLVKDLLETVAKNRLEPETVATASSRKPQMFDQEVVEMIENLKERIVNIFKYHAGEDENNQKTNIIKYREQIAKNVACSTLMAVTSDLKKEPMTSLKAKQILFPITRVQEVPSSVVGDGNDDDDEDEYDDDEHEGSSFAGCGDDEDQHEEEGGEKHAASSPKVSNRTSQREVKTPKALKDYEKGPLVKRRKVQ